MQDINIKMKELNNTNLLVTETVKEKKVYNFFKRFLDMVIAIIGIVVLSPVMLIVAILVRVDSPGKVVFAHERIGKNSKKIKIYKFRSMYENSEEIFRNFTEDQKKEYYENFKLDNDPRITKVGKVIRKTSLDELPQLINVIRGDMSIVGPRPIVEAEISKYGVYFEKFTSVTPGVTGYWQANGRSETTYDERVKMDMYYIDNRSLLLDTKIIIQTIISVIKKEGAI